MDENTSWGQYILREEIKREQRVTGEGETPSFLCGLDFFREM